MHDILQKIIDNIVDNKKIFGVILNVKHGDNSYSLASGNLEKEHKFFIASTTKLYITTIIMKLRHENKLQLDDFIAQYLPSTVLENLHICNGVEYSQRITIKQLLAHTSGIADYFEGKDTQKKSLKDRLLAGEDTRWSFEESIQRSKSMPAYFEPNKPRKAHYSDTNFQLLGKIIETVTNKSLVDVLDEYIFKPLKLHETYMYHDSNDSSVRPMYYQSQVLHIPQAMSSFGADGGIVSTSQEVMIFLEAFFQGKLFPISYINDLQEWNKGFFGIELGVGIMRFKLPWFFSPFKPFPEIVGHSGLSGAFAFYAPKKNIFLTGTLNQLAHPEQSYKLILKILSKIK